jgi:tartrate dehydrogenase/decarboxylase/D-malate dehydrogenase
VHRVVRDLGDHRLRVAAVPGDGVGPEVIEATLPLLGDAAALDGVAIEITMLDWGGERFVRTGSAMPDDAAEQISRHQAVLFGAVGRSDIPDHVSVWGLILALRQALDLYVNLRPVATWPGVPTPLLDGQEIDFLIIRENTEGEYTGAGGRSHAGTRNEVAVEVSVHSRRAIERVARYAFRRASERRGQLTLATKSNASKYGYVLWDEVVSEVHADFPDVTYERVFVDALAASMVERPRSLDVIVCSNLFGDILSDLGASLQGGLGMAPSANIAPGRSAPGIFEPVHGSAPDIAGRGIANPVACVLSAALLLDECGCQRGATALQSAVRAAVQDPRGRTPDVGGTATTAQAANAIGEWLSKTADAKGGQHAFRG